MPKLVRGALLFTLTTILSGSISFGYSFAGSTNNIDISSTGLSPDLISGINYYASSAASDTVRQLDTSKPVGATPFTASVSSTGAATINIPVFSLPGTNGMEPGISIFYNSQSGNGVLGYGWHISGLSQISRTDKNMFYDNETKSISLTKADRYSLNGERLMYSKVGSADTVYFSETSPFSRITAFETSGKGPSYFKEETKSGITLEYGNSTDSKVILPGTTDGTIYKWLIKKAVDKNGNYIKYNYGISNGEYWIRSIEYTGNNEQSLQPYDSITFNYSTRFIDRSFSYVKGKAILFSKRLDQISIYCEGVEVRKYTFDYEEDLHTKLVGINEFDKFGNSYNPVVINYGSDGNLKIESEINFFDYGGSEHIYSVGDYNGDGFDDILTWVNALTWYGWALYTNNKSGSFEKTDIETWDTNYGSEPIEYYLAGGDDLNGDGMADAFFKKNDSIIVYFGLPNNKLFHCSETFSDPGDIASINGLTEYFTGDFNGDGICEMLLIGTDSALIHSFKSRQDWKIGKPDVYKCKLVDFDGDGKTDLLSFNINGYILTSFNYNRTTNSYTIPQSATFTSSVFNSLHYDKIFDGDFNGDLKTDFLVNYGTTWYIMYSTGSCYEFDDADPLPMLSGFDINTSSNGNSLFVRDINNDGKSDIVQISPYRHFKGFILGTKISYHLSRGLFFKTEENLMPGYTTLYNSEDFTFGNFSGDGLMNCLFYRSKIMKLKNDDRSKAVKSVLSGINCKTDFIFSGSVLPDNALERQSIDTVIYKPFMDLIVDTLIMTGSDDRSKTMHFSYANPFYHKGGKGFLGFANQTVTDNTSGIKTITSFKANEEYAYTYPSTTRKTDGTGTVLTENNVTVSNISYSYGSFFPYASQVISNDLVHNVTDTTLYSYDSFGNNLSTVYKQNGEVITSTSNEYIQKGTWCPSRLSKATVTRNDYGNNPAYNRYSEFGYDNKGQVIRSAYFVNMSDSLNVRMTYNNFGNILTKTTDIADGNTRKEVYGYDAKRRFVTSITRGGLVYSRNYEPSTGSLITESSPNGLVKTYEYDGFGRITKEKVSDSQYISTQYQWSIGSPESAVYYIRQTDGITESKKWFDNLGRDISTKTTGFSGNEVFIDKQYSLRNQILKESRPYLAGNTPIWNEFSYDTIGRIESLYVNGGNISYSYNNNSTTVSNMVNGENRTYTATINGAGQISSTEQNGKTLSFAYDNNGSLSSVTPPHAGSSLNYNYDARSMKREETDPDMGTLKFNHNALGELTHFETAKGDSDSLIYDISGRDSIRIRKDGNTTYTYYQSGVAKGQLKQVSKNSGFKKYSYDIYGHITRECDSLSVQDYFPFSYMYDDHGRISKMTYPGGFAITYHYNANGYLEYIKRASDNSVIWQCNSTNESGNITQYSMANGNIIRNNSYNQYGYLTEIKTTAGAVTKQWYEYSFDANSGDISWRKDKNRSITENFGYDVFDQLKWSKVTGQDSLLLNYNDIGNITYKSDAGTYSYNSTRIHAVESINGSNDTTRQNIEYNFFNKPVFISTPSDSLVYTYTLLDERIKAVLYNSSHQVVKTTWYAGPYEKVVQGSVTKHYYYINSPDGLIALAIQTGSGTPVIYYICKDHLGSITAIMNSSGAILEEYNYDPWGRRRNPVNWSYSNVSVPAYTSRGFTGHEHLDQFNMIHMNGRIYDPETARFLSPDPIIKDSYNLLCYNRYSYCMNNPLKYSDPTGYIHRRPEEPSPIIDWSCYYNYGYRTTPGGGGGGYHSYINSFGNNGYHYNENDGKYYNYRHEEVSWGEVYNNYVKPNSISVSLEEGLQWIANHFKRENPCHCAPPLISQEGGTVWLTLCIGLNIKAVLKSNLIPDGYYQDHYQLILGVYGKTYSDYNWIQVVYHDGELIKDGRNNYGFYYFDSDKPFVYNFRSDIPGANYYFEDTPNAKSFYAYLTLCGKTGDQWVPIATFTWGYNANGYNSIYFNQINDVPSVQLEYVDDTLKYHNHH